ncbi:bacterio-opsin activator domain-containing protein [Salinirubrum litoreum]|uniref:Bacterio-opsin activator domain-containing protein n=1 Tax=Salinirubrum litoreum TaxID=1126234 RepID=A0ABD5R6H7_9EURY
MSVVAEFTAGIDDFPLGPALGVTDTQRVELERVVPTDGGVLPFFWVWTDDPDAYVSAAGDHPAVESVTVLSRVDDGALCRARWVDDGTGLIAAIVASGVTVLDTTTDGDRWRIRVRATDRDDISSLLDQCRASEVDIELRRLAPESGPDEHDGLTDAQREILLLALESGYFEEPREASLEDLASELGVSRQAVGTRLRRAYGNLIEHSLVLP